jgi:hypothetical protein
MPDNMLLALISDAFVSIFLVSMFLVLHCELQSKAEASNNHLGMS